MTRLSPLLLILMPIAGCKTASGVSDSATDLELDTETDGETGSRLGADTETDIPPSIDTDDDGEADSESETLRDVERCLDTDPPSWCVVPPLYEACGNGRVEYEERCDDGNKLPGDGCTGVCEVERYYSCPSAGGPCEHDVVAGTRPAEASEDGHTLESQAFAEA